jgi:predicted ATPase
VVRESVDVYADGSGSEPVRALVRVGIDTKVRLPSQDGTLVAELAPVGSEALALPYLGVGAPPDIQRLIDALDRIDVHVPFETRALWQQPELGLAASPRLPCLLETATKLDRFGINLPNAFQTLRNRGGAAWLRLLERARIGLGDDLRDFSLTPLGRGHVGLEILFGTFPDTPLPAESLSDGQIAYLCFLALFEFHESRSLLVFDEPEVHLHPQLLARVAWLFEEAASKAPVIVATHSDRFLDSLSALSVAHVHVQFRNLRGGICCWFPGFHLEYLGC